MTAAVDCERQPLRGDIVGAAGLSCLERVEHKSDRQIDEQELRPCRRCVTSASAPAISMVASAERRLT
jgi:hypothetical protein